MLDGLRQAIDIPPFGELADPRILAELAAAAEERGWDGFFIWDHVVYRAPVRAVADPWVALAAIACATSRCGSDRWSPRCRADGCTSWLGRPSPWTC